MAFAEPSAVVVPARILKRVIKTDRGLRPFGGGPTARKTSYLISGQAFGEIVSEGEMGRRASEPWPETVLLLACPDPEELAEASPGTVLVTAWRRLFRRRIAAELSRAFGTGAIDAPGLAARIEVIGGTEFEEASAVLRQEGWLESGTDDAEAFVAFAAAFLDLTSFAPTLRGYTFPAIEHTSTVENLLAADLDVPALLAATRPAGAPDPETLSVPAETDTEDDPDQPEGHHTLVDRARAKTLSASAKLASERGNSVRAAILHAGSARGLNAEEAEPHRAAARGELKHLADRLTGALFVRKGESEVWADALAPLLRHAAHGFWAPEARLLYDLQKVCSDHEREVYRIDLVGWLVSFGRRPLQRPLPHLRIVAMANHLRSASKRLSGVRLSHEERWRLEGLLRGAFHRVEHDLRSQFGPPIESTLAATWVKPRDLPERVAFGKLVDEMLDKVAARGFTTLGDLRDAASKCNLKLPDLTGPVEFFQGDRLLKADEELANRLDGIHRHGEVYLRWLQRFSSLAFGTPVGRFLTLFLALPFGGAFVLLRGLQEIDELGVSHLTGTHHHFVHTWSILLVGSIALGAINFRGFRHRLVGMFCSLGRTLRAVFVDLPTWLLYNPLLHRVLSSRTVVGLWTYAIKPGLVALPAWALARVVGMGRSDALGVWVGTFFSAGFLFNTRSGRALEEVVAERVIRSLKSLVLDVVPGLFRLVMSAFAHVLEWVEKLIYAVDEWLRFRRGQSTVVLVLKGTLGLVWGVVAYLVRIYVNLLIEPQINPIKHFPVVTVSHKVILPMSLKIGGVFAAVLIPILGKDLGLFVSAANVLLLPGVFGFLVWELKSNWRLYEANRAEALGPVVVGSHGETIVGLLRPGFHSGTLPKLYARLRRDRRGGRDGAALKRREALHHVEESVRQFVDRDLAALLRETRGLGGQDVRVGEIRLATNRIRVELLRGEHDAPGLWFDLEERSGTLAAGLSRPGWLSSLDGDERRMLGDALAGLYKMSGVSLVHVPGAPIVAPAPSPVVLGLLCSPTPNSSVPFAEVVIPWSAWVSTWEAEHADDHASSDRLDWPGLLPAPEHSQA